MQFLTRNPVGFAALSKPEMTFLVKPVPGSIGMVFVEIDTPQSDGSWRIQTLGPVPLGNAQMIAQQQAAARGYVAVMEPHRPHVRTTTAAGGTTAIPKAKHGLQIQYENTAAAFAKLGYAVSVERIRNGRPASGVQQFQTDYNAVSQVGLLSAVAFGTIAVDGIAGPVTSAAVKRIAERVTGQSWRSAVSNVATGKSAPTSSKYWPPSYETLLRAAEDVHACKGTGAFTQRIFDSLSSARAFENELLKQGTPATLEVANYGKWQVNYCAPWDPYNVPFA